MTEFWVSQGNKWCDFWTRHKENVAKKLAGIKKDNAVKEKENMLALKDLEMIETQAKKSYERDLAAMRRLDTKACPAGHGGSGHDPANQNFVNSAFPETLRGQAPQTNTDEAKRTRDAAHGSSGASRFRKSSKGMVASSLEVSKRKRVEKLGSKSGEDEAAALAARESARKRIKEREESLLGLYHSF